MSGADATSKAESSTQFFMLYVLLAPCILLGLWLCASHSFDAAARLSLSAFCLGGITGCLPFVESGSVRFERIVRTLNMVAVVTLFPFLTTQFHDVRLAVSALSVFALLLLVVDLPSPETGDPFFLSLLSDLIPRLTIVSAIVSIVFLIGSTGLVPWVEQANDVEWVREFIRLRRVLTFVVLPGLFLAAFRHWTRARSVHIPPLPRRKVANAGTAEAPAHSVIAFFEQYLLLMYDAARPLLNFAIKILSLIVSWTVRYADAVRFEVLDQLRHLLARSLPVLRVAALLLIAEGGVRLSFDMGTEFMLYLLPGGARVWRLGYIVGDFVIGAALVVGAAMLFRKRFEPRQQSERAAQAAMFWGMVVYSSGLVVWVVARWVVSCCAVCANVGPYTWIVTALLAVVVPYTVLRNRADFWRRM